MKFEPGSKFEYNNPGINTVGRIIEVVSGMPYEEFMARRLFEPLGMKDTTFWPTPAQVQRLAKTYKPNADKSGLEATSTLPFVDPRTGRKLMPFPAGGLFSTATDVSLFCRMILNGGDLERETLPLREIAPANDLDTDRQSARGLRFTVGSPTGSLAAPSAMAVRTRRTCTSFPNSNS